MSEYDGKAVCGNCVHFGEDLSHNKVCRRFPPQVAAAPVMSPAIIPGAKPEVSWIVQGMYPPARDRMPGCGEFRTRPEIVN